MAHQMAIETQQELRKLPGNNRCVDCDAPYPQWATVSYGTFMCLECSGRHRGLGVHISFVRSVSMDSWTDKQIALMQNGGNDKFRQEFASAGVPTNLSIQQKYNTPQAETYRQCLTATVEGKPLPPMPKWNPSCLPQSGGGAGSHRSSSSSFSGAGDSKGVEALKGESEQDYVTRQMRLKEEARARMQAKFGAGGLQGIGSGGETAAPSYNAGGIADLSSAFSYLSTTVSSVASTAVNAVRDGEVGAKVSTGWSYVQNTLTDPNLSTTVKSTASTGWSTLSSGANSVWKTAQTVVDTAVNSPRNDGPSNFPRTNPTLNSSGKYSGMGNTEVNARDHDNDNWLNAQLSSSSTRNTMTSTSSFKSNSFGGSSSSSSSTTTTSSTSFSSTKSSNSFSNSTSVSSSSSFSSTPSPPKSSPAPIPPVPRAPSMSLSTPAPAPSSAPTTSPTPAPNSATKKKEVDFFGEYGF